MLRDSAPDLPGKPVAHDVRRSFEVGNRFKQRHDVQRRAACHWVIQTRFFRQHQHFEHVRHRFAMRDDVVGHGGCAEACVGCCCLGKHVQLFDCFVRIACEGRAQQAWLRELDGEQCAFGAFIERRIVALDAGRSEQLGHHALHHVRALTQVHRCEMKAEHLGRAQQGRETRAREGQ